MRCAPPSNHQKLVKKTRENRQKIIENREKRVENHEKLVKKIPGAAMIAVPSNQYAHEPDVLVDIDKFYQSL